MDEAYPQADHVTKYRLPGDGTEIDSTQWEAMQIAAGEREISKIVRGWDRVRHGVAAPARQLFTSVHRLGREVRQHEARLEAKGYASPREWPTILVVVVLGALALTEFPLTRGSLDWLRLTVDETRVVAAGVCLFMMAISHGLGQSLRQGTWGAMSTFFGVVLVGAWISLGLLRVEFVNTQAEERRIRLEAEIAVITGTVGGTTVTAGAGAPVTGALSDTSTVALIVVTAIGLAGGVLVGYRAHDPDPDVKHVVKAERRARSGLSREIKKLLRAAARHDARRGDIEQRITFEQERILQTIREHRYASELWRLPAKNRPPSFAEAVDESLFKPRKLGPELLPVALELEAALGLRTQERDEVQTVASQRNSKIDLDLAEPVAIHG